MAEIRPTAYTAYPDGYDQMINSDKHAWTLKIELSGTDPDGRSWAVRWMGTRYSRDGERDFEPNPSSRTGHYIEHHSFTLDEAMRRASKWVDELIVNGRTAQQASDDVAARLATRTVKEGAS